MDDAPSPEPEHKRERITNVGIQLVVADEPFRPKFIRVLVFLRVVHAGPRFDTVRFNALATN